MNRVLFGPVRGTPGATEQSKESSARNRFCSIQVVNLESVDFFLIGWWSVALDFIDKFQSLAMQINQSDREVTFNSPLFSPLKNQALC